MACRTVLVVEDDESIRDALKAAIEMEGYEVGTAEDGRRGLEALARLPRPCLILLDLMMPVMNGWEFAEALGEDDRLATIPIVVVTAYTRQAKGINAKRVLKKPVDLDALLGAVRTYCGEPTTEPRA